MHNKKIKFKYASAFVVPFNKLFMLQINARNMEHIKLI
jgi:hypothetical protein